MASVVQQFSKLLFGVWHKVENEGNCSWHRGRGGVAWSFVLSFSWYRKTTFRDNKFAVYYHNSCLLRACTADISTNCQHRLHSLHKEVSKNVAEKQSMRHS